MLQAQRTKATVPLLRAAKRVILLTGTPALNKPKVSRIPVVMQWAGVTKPTLVTRVVAGGLKAGEWQLLTMDCS